MAPVALTAGQSPKFEKRPPPGAGSPSCATTRGRPSSSGEDPGGDRRRLEVAMKGDRALIAQADPLGELREDAADGRVVSCSEHHAKASSARDEDPAGHRPAFHGGTEGDHSVAVQARRPEGREGAAGGRGVALRYDLLQLAAGGEQHDLDGLPPAPHRRQERDVSPGIDRGRVDAGQHAGGDPGRGRPAQRDGPDPAVAGDEDALDRAPLGDGRREHDRAVVAQPGHRVLAEAGQAAHASNAIALARHGRDAAARPQKEPFVRCRRDRAWRRRRRRRAHSPAPRWASPRPRSDRRRHRRAPDRRWRPRGAAGTARRLTPTRRRAPRSAPAPAGTGGWACDGV